MKILQFPIRNNNGGVTKYILDNWKYIDRERFQFDFVTLNNELDFEEGLVKTGANVFHITCFAEDDETEFRHQLKEILKRGYDAIHIHTGAWKSVTVEEVAKECGVPRIIIHAHSSGYVTSAQGEEKQALLDRHEEIKNNLSHELATDFWACSREAANWLYGNSIPDNDIKILMNGIDSSVYKYSAEMRSYMRKQFDVENDLVLGHVGRFSKEKNHVFLLKVLQCMKKYKKNVKLMLVGTGKLEQEIKQMVRTMELEGDVIFLGKRTDVQNVYQMIDIFLLPSEFEGSSIVLVEAQAAGLPCITTKNVPKSSNVTNLVVYLPLDAGTWCEVINKTMCAKKDRGEAYRLIQERGYDKKQTVNELEQLYEGQKCQK